MENLTRENATQVEFKGNSLDECIKFLSDCREHGKSVWITFEGKKLYSCDATINNIYIQIYGKTKEEYEQDLTHSQEDRTNIDEKEVETEFIRRGSKYIYKEKMKEWEKCVSLQLQDSMNGNDLELALNAMQRLQHGTSFEEVSRLIRSNPEGNSKNTVAESIILNFSKKGPEFYQYINGGIENIDQNTRKMLENLRAQNKIYELESNREINEQISNKKTNEISEKDSAERHFIEMNPREELKQLAREKRELEAQLRNMENELSRRSQSQDKGIGE